VSAEEGLLPVEFVSRSLYTPETARSGFFFIIEKEVEIGRLCGMACDSYLVEVCAGFRGYAFEDLHILNEKLTGNLDLSRIGTIFPAGAKSGVDEAVSPDRVKTCRLGVHAGHLSAGDEANGREEEILRDLVRFPGG